MSLILPPDYVETRKTLDLNVYHWRQKHGPILAFGTWYIPPETPDSGHRPCMVLIRERELGLEHERVCPVIIPMDSAWKYSEEYGPSGMAYAIMAEFAPLLGIARENRREVLRLVMIVRSHLDDILKLPPRPPVDRQVVADARIYDPETGQSRTMEVSDDVSSF